MTFPFSICTPQSMPPMVSLDSRDTSRRLPGFQICVGYYIAGIELIASVCTKAKRCVTISLYFFLISTLSQGLLRKAKSVVVSTISPSHHDR